MKTIISLLLALLISVCISYSQKNKYIPKPKNMEFIPSGKYYSPNLEKEISINAFWISNEITNKEFGQFVSYLKANPEDSLLIFQLYSENQDKRFIYISNNKVLEKINMPDFFPTEPNRKYFSDKKFLNYPVVGVSFENAIHYCAWLNMIDSQKQNDYIVEYRLPLAEEWEYIASNFSTDNRNTEEKKINKSKSGKKNTAKIYNINSNVSEWTMSKTKTGMRIAKGSSWNNDLSIFDGIETDSNFRNNEIGFRVVKTSLFPR